MPRPYLQTVDELTEEVEGVGSAMGIIIFFRSIQGLLMAWVERLYLNKGSAY